MIRLPFHAVQSSITVFEKKPFSRNILMVQTLMKKDKVVCKLYLAEARDGIQKFSKLFFFFQRYAAFFYDLTDELVRERN